MFYNFILNKINCLVLIIFFNFISINSQAKNLYINNTKEYDVEIHFLVDDKITKHKISHLSKQNSDIKSYDFSEFGLDDELNNTNNSIITISDPFESINRKFFKFSLWFDEYAFQYISHIYLSVITKPIRMSFVNALNNFNEPISAVNHFLQFKFISFTRSTARFLINSTLGFFGFVDVASKLNLPQNYNDFGYTMSYYNIGDGFYLFLPLLGPYTLQTAVADVGTNYAYSLTFDKLINMNSFFTVIFNLSQRGIPYMENKMSFMAILNSSDDPYTLIKSAYLQNRKSYFQTLKQTW